MTAFGVGKTDKRGTITFKETELGGFVGIKERFMKTYEERN